MRILVAALPTTLLFLSSGLAIAQPRQPAPTVLMGPADWRFEHLPTPPPFAPGVTLTGFEEARFAPGMFNTSSDTYFTCVLVIVLDGAPVLDRASITDFLEKYYRGLSIGVGQRKGLKLDPAQMSATVAPAKTPNRYTAKVVFFDSFSDGRKVDLNIEAHAISRPGAAKSYLSLLVSPQPRDGGIWPKLREIESGLHFPEP